MGIRLSIGAGRARLMRMLLTEILLLATLAGALSAYFAFQAAIFAKLFATSSMPVYQTKPDLPVMIYLGATILAAAIVAGLSPAAESLRADLHSAMKPGGLRTSANRRRSFLVAAQVAMSLVLLVCAALFLRAQYTMFTADPGFETRRVLFVSLPAPRAGAADRIREIPGVDAVAAGYPLSQDEMGTGADEVRLPGQAAGSGKPTAVTAVSTNYFDTLKIPLLRGRSATNGRESVVSQAFAESWWPGQDPLGEPTVLADGTVAVVVGVARDVESEHSGAMDGPHLYRWRDLSSADSLLIRFRGDAGHIRACS